MKIEIDIDIESIVIEAIKKNETSDTYIPIKEIRIPASSSTTTQWEYARPPEGKQRRTSEEMSLHKKELELGRRLTPEEKGEVKAQLHIADSKEEKAKESAIKKAHIEDLTNQGLEAAKEELEAERLDKAPESGPKVNLKDQEETIPEAKDYNLPESLFS